MCLYRILISRLPPDLAPLLSRQVAGFHRAVPSTALDKASMQFVFILHKIIEKSRHISSKIHAFSLRSTFQYEIRQL